MNGTNPADFTEGFYTGLVAFTWTPNPAKYHSCSPAAQYKQLIDTVLNSNKLKHTLQDYYFVPELNTNGNIHIHGWYKIKDRIKYYKWFIPACKCWGFTLVKNKNINEKWVEYVNKEFHDTLDILGEGTPMPWCDSVAQEYQEKRRVLQDYPRFVFKKPKNILKYFSKK